WTSWTVAALLAWQVALPAGARTIGTPAQPKDPDEPKSANFGASIDVALVTTVVRIVDLGGNPILGLGPADLRVRVGRREVPVVALDWVGSEDEQIVTQPSEIPAAPKPAPIAQAPARGGRLVVVFVQTDFDPSRLSGQLRLRPYTRELLAALGPRDRVAVVSFD